MHSKRIWLLAAALAACTNAHGPQEGTQTGNPPILDRGKVTLEVSADEVHVTGKPGAATPGGATIEITNHDHRQGDRRDGGRPTARSTCASTARSNDTFVVRAVANGEQSDPVYVVRGGAEIADSGSRLAATRGSARLSYRAKSMPRRPTRSSPKRSRRLILGAKRTATALWFREGTCASCNAAPYRSRLPPSRSWTPWSSAAAPARSPSVARRGRSLAIRSEYVPRCEAGQCTQAASAVPDGGVPDCTTCFAETLTWGEAAAFARYYDQSEIAPCARYAPPPGRDQCGRQRFV